jgi:hypothetical protein
MCDEVVRRRWLSISQGFIPILATCMSFKKWVRAVQFDRGEHARAAVRKSCRISFHTGMQHVKNGAILLNPTSTRLSSTTSYAPGAHVLGALQFVNWH